MGAPGNSGCGAPEKNNVTTAANGYDIAGSGDMAESTLVSAETACEILHKAFPRKRYRCGGLGWAIQVVALYAP